VRDIPLPQKYGMRTLRGPFEALRQWAAADDRRTLDLVRIVVTDRIMVPGSHDSLRQCYPQLLEFHHERPPAEEGGADQPAPAAVRRSEGEFLDAFFAARYPGDLGDDVRVLARECMEQAIRQEDTA
jgi:hypothetical protein